MSHNPDNKECPINKIDAIFRMAKLFELTISCTCQKVSQAREEAPLQGDSECFEVPSWQTSFKHEFGIHFSPSELQFATEFIRTEIEKTKEEMEANLEESAWAKAFSLMERTELLRELKEEVEKMKPALLSNETILYAVLALIDAHLVSNK